MAYEIVQCEVVWNAGYYVSGNEQLGTSHILGEFETRAAAEQAFINAGFVLDEYDTWRANYRSGYISRILRELKKER